MIAERIMALGGISIAMAADVAEMAAIARPPRGREDVPTQLARLLEAYEFVAQELSSEIGRPWVTCNHVAHVFKVRAD